MLLSHLFENDDLPLLAQIIMQRLDAGETVGIDAVLQPKDSPLFAKLTGISVSRVRWRADALLTITWENFTRPGDGKKQISAAGFDDKFELIKDDDGDWLLVNVTAQVNEIQNADPELLIELTQKLLKKGEKVFVRFMDDKMETCPIKSIDDSDGVMVDMYYEDEWQGFDLNPKKHWTLSKEQIGWVIHAVK